MNKKMQRHWLFVLRPFYQKGFLYKNLCILLGRISQKISASLSLLEESPISDRGKRKTVCHWRREGGILSSLSHKTDARKKRKKRCFPIPPTPFSRAYFFDRNVFLKICHPVWWSPPCARQSPPPSPPAERWGRRPGKTRRTPGNGTKMLNKIQIKCKISELVKLLTWRSTYKDSW